MLGEGLEHKIVKTSPRLDQRISFMPFLTDTSSPKHVRQKFRELFWCRWGQKSPQVSSTISCGAYVQSTRLPTSEATWLVRAPVVTTDLADHPQFFTLDLRLKKNGAQMGTITPDPLTCGLLVWSFPGPNAGWVEITLSGKTTKLKSLPIKKKNQIYSAATLLPFQFPRNFKHTSFFQFEGLLILVFLDWILNE